MRFSHLTSTIGSPRARNPATPTACGSNRQCDPPDNTRRRARSFRRREGGTRRSRNGPGGREARHAPTGECLRRVTGPGSAARVRIRRERSTQTRMIRNKCSPYSHAAPPPFGVNPLTETRPKSVQRRRTETIPSGGMHLGRTIPRVPPPSRRRRRRGRVCRDPRDGGSRLTV